MERKLKGSDDQGKEFESIEEIWTKECNADKNLWYQKGSESWDSKDLTLESVLGFQELQQPDVEDSRLFLSEVFERFQISKKRALDVAAGFGRVTKHVLLDYFDKIDLMDQCAKFVNYAPEFVNSSKLEKCILAGVQNFFPEQKVYSCIWIQWVLCQLTDEDLVEFLRRTKTGLEDNGIIVIKENVKNKKFLVHTDDWSVTRPETYLRSFIESAGLEIFFEKEQENFPEDTLRVKMFACKPVINC